MSVSNLSATLQKDILKKLIDNVTRDLQSAQSLPKVAKYDFSISTPTSMLRDITDRNQINIFTKDAANNLALEYSKMDLAKLKSSGRVFDKEGNISKSAGIKTLKKALASAKSPQDMEALVSTISKEVALILEVPSFWASLEKEAEDRNLLHSSMDGVIELIPSSHGTFLKLFISLVSSKSNRVSKDLVADFLSATLDTGHLLGIFNQRLIRSIGSGEVKYKSSIVGDITAKIIDDRNLEEQKEVAKLNNIYTAALGTLEQLDFLSSQLVFRPDIFIKLSKEVYNSTNTPTAAAEFQLSFLNSAAGREIASAGRALSDIMNKAVSDIRNKKKASISYDSSNEIRPSSISFAEGLEDVFEKIASAGKSISTTIDGLIVSTEKAQAKLYLQNIKKLSEQFGQTLLETKGSDSIVESVLKTMGNTLSGTSLPGVQKTSVSKTYKPTEKVKKQTLPKRATSKVRKQVKPNIFLKPTALPASNGLGLSLTALQNLINANLAEKIKENMGDGNARNLLNLRSGRLAESAQVERMSQSRAGMITAFYSYMKNPYATFSAGGRQQDPKSRDPKLLIAKSIREIAAQQVGNRLRSVLV